MAVQSLDNAGMKPTLGLTGVTINAMALIAPGAFLWTTFQLQASSNGSGDSMWSAVFVAVLIALLTAIAYAALANQYPEAGTGSSYYYAEIAFLQREEHRHFKFARLSKFIVGWASHLYYWVYPGVMVAFMGLVIEYIIQSFNPSFGTGPSGPFELIAICVVFSIVVGAIAYIGVTGSTLVNIIINVLQILALLTFSVTAILFRLNHPDFHYVHPNVFAVLTPKSFNNLFFQSTIAILLVVGFESATAFAAEAKNPRRDIPRGVILSLIIQGVIFYFIEYFAANFVLGDSFKIPSPSGTGFLTGLDAAGASGAPIGDIAHHIFGGAGNFFATVIAASVVIALVGTALSCLNTGVRVTYAMGKDKELPVVFGFLHGKYRTPHMAIIVLVVISAIVGSYGVLDIDKLTQVTLISNIGTFILYGMTCIICLVAFAGVAGRNVFSTIIAPFLGAALNIIMLVFVIYYAIVGASNTKIDAIVAGTFSVIFLVLGFTFLFIRKLTTGVPILHPEDYRAKTAVASEPDKVAISRPDPIEAIPSAMTATEPRPVVPQLTQSILSEGDFKEIFGSDKPKVTLLENPPTFSIRLEGEPLTPHNLTSVISAITDLSTKCWLMAKGRLADLFEYTQTHEAHFTEETHLILTRITYNSTLDMSFSIDRTAPNLVEALKTAMEGVVQAQRGLEDAELEYPATAEHRKVARPNTNPTAILEHEITLKREQLEILEKRLNVQKEKEGAAFEIAAKTVTLLYPNSDEETKTRLIQALQPDFLQLQNSQELEFAVCS
jgi:APA family basic amino acid/polyamine antiporter